MKETPLYAQLIKIIAETNGLSLMDTLELLRDSSLAKKSTKISEQATNFIHLLNDYHQNKIAIQDLLDHPISVALYHFFKSFPLKFKEEHIHLTGSLAPDFVFKQLKPLLKSKHGDKIKAKLKEVYNLDKIKIDNSKDVAKLIQLQEGERFEKYLQILFLPKLILVDREAHSQAAYHMASTMYHQYNVGSIRLKFTLSRASGKSEEQIPGTENITERDVLFGLYEGFKTFQKAHPDFKFTLSPCFRKEAWFYDTKNFSSKKDHFDYQVKQILEVIENHPYLKDHLNEVDTVGDEKNLFRKKHFDEMRSGFRRLQYSGFTIRSHHGETWKTLRRGIQSVDNAMNIWHLNNLEHGLSLGVNPNYYFQKLYHRVMEKNQLSQALEPDRGDALELEDMNWLELTVKEKLLKGVKLDSSEEEVFIKTKFHHAREIEHYQHDVLNRMINKGISLVALPSSNMKLTEAFPDYKDHPFSWWEKKGVHLGVGTDNYVTLNTDYLKEMLILLFSDPRDLKITKLLMVTTGEKRRPYISDLLWKMKKSIFN